MYNFKFNYFSRGQLVSLNLDKIFLPLIKMLPCYDAFFSNLIFAIIARMLCGNHLHKLFVREILSLSFVCGAYFFEFRDRNLVSFDIAYNFNGKFAPEARKVRMRTAFFTRVYNSLVIRDKRKL